MAGAFAADNGSFQSAASSTQQALHQLPSNASAQQVSQEVQPLLAAANDFQADLVNLQWPVGVKPMVQTLLQRLGQVAALLNEAQRGVGFSSVSQFRSDLNAAIGTVNSASSTVSAVSARG